MKHFGFLVYHPDDSLINRSLGWLRRFLSSVCPGPVFLRPKAGKGSDRVCTKLVSRVDRRSARAVRRVPHRAGPVVRPVTVGVMRRPRKSSVPLGPAIQEDGFTPTTQGSSYFAARPRGSHGFDQSWCHVCPTNPPTGQEGPKSNAEPFRGLVRRGSKPRRINSWLRIVRGVFVERARPVCPI